MIVRAVASALALFASALIVGFFYAYHWSVMPGLAAGVAERSRL